MAESRCRHCDRLISWRVSAKSGRKYAVNADPSNGPIGQFHSLNCPNKPKRGTTVAPVSAKIAPTVTESTHKATSADPDSLASLIAEHVAKFIPASAVSSVNEDRVRELIAESSRQSIVVSVRDSDSPAINVGRQHKQFPILLAIIARRRNTWMVGPAGSGKTRAAHEAARALDLEFGAISVGPQTTQSALFGYMDAHGKYVATEFRRRYEQGGVFLFDEIDRGNPGVLTALNQAIENGSCAFPDSMIERHDDFVAIAAGNTYGTGASREYVGALQLDAATLDRFVMLAWEYDETLEQDIAEATYKAAGGTKMLLLSNWIGKVRKARKQAEALKVRVVISPRASIVGADLLGSGMDESTVAACVLWKGLDADTVARLS